MKNYKELITATEAHDRSIWGIRNGNAEVLNRIMDRISRETSSGNFSAELTYFSDRDSYLLINVGGLFTGLRFSINAIIETLAILGYETSIKKEEATTYKLIVSWDRIHEGV